MSELRNKLIKIAAEGRIATNEFIKRFPKAWNVVPRPTFVTESSEYKKLLEELSTLKSELKREKLRADFYEEMVAFGKEVYGIDLKKAGTK